jgi:hypothetical protein
MSPLTIYLGRFIGLGLLLMCLALALRPKASLATINSMMHEPALLLVTGIMTMAAGVALVVGHNLWSGPPLTWAVTIVGWITLLKGLAISALPSDRLAGFYRAINYEQRFRLVMVLGAVAGAWITWAAFTATPQVQV